MKPTPLLATLVLATLASSVSAQNLIIPTHQSRRVTASYFADDLSIEFSDFEQEESSDFGPFNQLVSSDLLIPDANCQSNASQDSSIGPNFLTASASTVSNATTYNFPWEARSSGYSQYVVSFDVTEKVAYTLTGVIGALDSGETFLFLTDEDGVEIYCQETHGGYPSVDHAGVLEPGNYGLALTALSYSTAGGASADYATAEFDIDMQFTAMSGRTCASAPNSAGPGAVIDFSGSQDIQDDDFHLSVSGSVPQSAGLFFYGPMATQQPFGDGFRCVGGGVFRLGPAMVADVSGTASRQVDFSSLPAGGGGPGSITAESTWHFQWWYRDTNGPGGSGWNLSDSIWVTFCP